MDRNKSNSASKSSSRRSDRAHKHDDRERQRSRSREKVGSKSRKRGRSESSSSDSSGRHSHRDIKKRSERKDRIADGRHRDLSVKQHSNMSGSETDSSSSEGANPAPRFKSQVTVTDRSLSSKKKPVPSKKEASEAADQGSDKEEGEISEDNEDKNSQKPVSTTRSKTAEVVEDKRKESSGTDKIGQDKRKESSGTDKIGHDKRKESSGTDKVGQDTSGSTSSQKGDKVAPRSRFDTATEQEKSKDSKDARNRSKKDEQSASKSRPASGSEKRKEAEAEPTDKRDKNSSRSRPASGAEKKKEAEAEPTDKRDKNSARSRGDTETASKKGPEEPAKKTMTAFDITSKTGGAYIPPAKLRMMQEMITDKTSAAYQRMSWEALKKSINGLINKVNVSNIINIIKELFQENIVRGRGLLARSVIQAQAASPTFTHVYAALVAIINTKFPQNGELILRRLILMFRRGYKRNDKALCLSSTSFIAHLINQQVAHEVLALEILTLLLENPTDDSVEVAIGFLKECGQKLTEVSPRGMNFIFERLRHVLHEGQLDIRVQYMVEVMFAIRKDGFKDHPSVLQDLDLVEEEEQFTHLLQLDDAIAGDELLNVFKADTAFVENEEKYKILKKEILGEESSDEESGESSGSESSESEAADEEDAEKQTIIDKTETNLVALRRIIYLTVQSSLDHNECAHKLLKMGLKPGQEVELCNMILDCCAQLRTYEKFFGLLAQRFCQIEKKYMEPFQQIFVEQYETIHRLETNKLRNIAKFFAHLLHTDAISWGVLSVVKLTEEDTSSASRIFLKILFQELSEYMGLAKLNQRLKDVTLSPYFAGIMARDNPKNTRFCINFFTTIGLGGLTDDLREHLKTATKQISEQKMEAERAEDKKSSSSDDSSSSSSQSSSDSSDSDSSDSDSTPAKRRKNRNESSSVPSQKKHEKKSSKAKNKKADKETSHKRKLDKDKLGKDSQNIPKKNVSARESSADYKRKSSSKGAEEETGSKLKSSSQTNKLAKNRHSSPQTRGKTIADRLLDMAMYGNIPRETEAVHGFNDLEREKEARLQSSRREQDIERHGKRVGPADDRDHADRWAQSDKRWASNDDRGMARREETRGSRQWDSRDERGNTDRRREGGRRAEDNHRSWNRDFEDVGDQRWRGNPERDEVRQAQKDSKHAKPRRLSSSSEERSPEPRKRRSAEKHSLRNGEKNDKSLSRRARSGSLNRGRSSSSGSSSSSERDESRPSQRHLSRSNPEKPTQSSSKSKVNESLKQKRGKSISSDSGSSSSSSSSSEDDVQERRIITKKPKVGVKK